MLDPEIQTLYTMFYGKEVKNIVPAPGNNNRQMILFSDGTEMLSQFESADV